MNKNKDLYKQVLGETIRDKRRHLGLTQAKVAEEANISEEYLGRIENGGKSPGAFILENISEALDIDRNEYGIIYRRKRVKLEQQDKGI